MSHFAKVIDDIVSEVIVAESEFFEVFQDSEPGQWIQTSYNTFGGEHKLGGIPLRKNYAGVGFSYDRGKDAFIPPKPFKSWILNEETCLWGPPLPQPISDIPHIWNEKLQQWEPDKI